MASTLSQQPDDARGDYETQGMALKLKELDDALSKYKTYSYPCEAHLTWCRRGAKLFSLVAEARRRGCADVDEASGACTEAAAYRVVLLDREEAASTELARPGQPTLCQACTQIAIDEHIFREIVPIAKADQMEQDFEQRLEAEARSHKSKK